MYQDLSTRHDWSVKKPSLICQSGWKEIRSAFPVIHWLRRGPRTRISALLHRRYYICDAGCSSRVLHFPLKCLLLLPTTSIIFIVIVKASRYASKFTMFGIHSACSRIWIAGQSNTLYIFNNYSTSARWIWVGYNYLIFNKREWNNCPINKTHKTSTILPDFVKTTDFQLVFNFEQTRIVTIFEEHSIMAHIPWWLSQSELSNCIIQWFSF